MVNGVGIFGFFCSFFHQLITWCFLHLRGKMTSFKMTRKIKSVSSFLFVLFIEEFCSCIPEATSQGLADHSRRGLVHIGRRLCPREEQTISQGRLQRPDKSHCSSSPQTNHLQRNELEYEDSVQSGNTINFSLCFWPVFAVFILQHGPPGLKLILL